MVLANPVGAVAGAAGHERERVLAGETARLGALGEVDRGRSGSQGRQTLTFDQVPRSSKGRTAA
jgi:hypothetical protein